uniref:Phosphatidylinositol 4-kinase type 2 n=1 Tax=Ditylenchus dipsaci TaxID=166011 RepID=A0A915DM06_9BILA
MPLHFIKPTSDLPEYEHMGKVVNNNQKVSYSAKVPKQSEGQVTLSPYIDDSNKFQLANSDESEFDENLRKAVEAFEAGIFPRLIPTAVQAPISSVMCTKPIWQCSNQRMKNLLLISILSGPTSLVDSRLNFGIVPRTRVVKLMSPTLFYGRRFGKQIEPRPKVGSYQMFVNGYEILFQKMCILDYIIRNTDRHMDNWLIRHIPNQELKIAAIDNGLAFQSSILKRLNWAHKPWDRELRDDLLARLSPLFVDKLCKELMALFD